MFYNTTTFTATEDRQIDRQRERDKQTDGHRQTERETGTDRMFYNTTTFTATEGSYALLQECGMVPSQALAHNSC